MVAIWRNRIWIWEHNSSSASVAKPGRANHGGRWSDATNSYLQMPEWIESMMSLVVVVINLLLVSICGTVFKCVPTSCKGWAYIGMISVAKVERFAAKVECTLPINSGYGRAAVGGSMCTFSCWGMGWIDIIDSFPGPLCHHLHPGVPHLFVGNGWVAGGCWGLLGVAGGCWDDYW